MRRNSERISVIDEQGKERTYQRLHVQWGPGRRWNVVHFLATSLDEAITQFRARYPHADVRPYSYQLSLEQIATDQRRANEERLRLKKKRRPKK